MAKKKQTKKDVARSDKAEKAAPKTRPCACGCGRETRSWFAPGHDARLAGQLGRLEQGVHPKAAGIAPDVFETLKQTVGFEEDDETGGLVLAKPWTRPVEVAAWLAGDQS